MSFFSPKKPKKQVQQIVPKGKDEVTGQYDINRRRLNALNILTSGISTPGNKLGQ